MSSVRTPPMSENAFDAPAPVANDSVSDNVSDATPTNSQQPVVTNSQQPVVVAFPCVTGSKPVSNLTTYYKGQHISDMKVSQLREALSHLGLNTYGSCKVLRERLNLVVQPGPTARMPNRKAYKSDLSLMKDLDPEEKLMFQEQRVNADLAVEQCRMTSNIMTNAQIDLRVLALEHSHAKKMVAFWSKKKKSIRFQLMKTRKMATSTRRKAQMARKAAQEKVKRYSSIRRQFLHQKRQTKKKK